MDRKVANGHSSKGKATVIFRNFEYVKHRDYVNGETQWRCRLYRSFKCQARLKTNGDMVVGNAEPVHNHDCNPTGTAARNVVSSMKESVKNVSATPATVIGSAVSNLSNDVLMALPKRASLKRTLQRSRHAVGTVNGTVTLPPVPNNMSFLLPAQFTDMVLYDSGPDVSGNSRIILLGCIELLDGLARSKLWIADGTFKVCPSLFFQFYTIHFELAPGINPAAVYCLLENKDIRTYARVLEQIANLIPQAAPERIILDFESAARTAFSQAYPHAVILGCYFHLCQSVLRKVQEVGMKSDYEQNDELRIAVRSLSALAMIPSDDVAEAFDLLAEAMPEHEKAAELLSYFEHTYIRGRRRAGRGLNYGSAIFPIETWNHHETALADSPSEYDKFNINKKFEVAEMAKLFFGRGMLIVFYFFMIAYLYGDLCIYLSVIGTTLRGLACPITPSRVNVLNETCISLGSSNVFRIFSSAFFIITAPFVFTNLKKSVGIQLATMFLRLLAVATMIACASMRISKNAPHDIQQVRWAGIPNFFGICLYSFMCQHSLPNMVNYVTKKSSKFNYFILFSMVVALLLYLLTVFTATFSFEGQDLQAIYSMNFSQKNEGWFYEFLYYYLMLFPTIALSASYPIIAITLRENIISLTEIILERPLNEKVKKYLYPILAILPSYVFVTLMPDSVSMIANLVGAYAGSFVQYFIPACLIIWARKKIKKEFNDIDLAKNRNSLLIFRNNVVPGLVILWTFVGIGIVTFYYLTK